jgi:hypothetical protein
MVTNPQNNSNPTGHVASASEQWEFARLTLHLQVDDFFTYSYPLVFTWDNKWRIGVRILKRLDRFYCYSNPNGLPSVHVLQYSILGDSLLLDHLPVQLRLEIQATQQSGSRYKMNGYYLKDKQVVLELNETWKCLPATLSIFGKLRRLTKWYKMFCLQQAKARKAAESSLRQQLEKAQAMLQVSP